MDGENRMLRAGWLVGGVHTVCPRRGVCYPRGVPLAKFYLVLHACNWEGEEVSELEQAILW